MSRAAESRSVVGGTEVAVGSGGARRVKGSLRESSEVEGQAADDPARQDGTADEEGAARGLVVVLARRAFGGRIGIQQVEHVDADAKPTLAAEPERIAGVEIDDVEAVQNDRVVGGDEIVAGKIG